MTHFLHRISFLTIIFLLFSSTSFAWEWIDLWERRDVQGAKLLTKGEPEKAAQRFKNPQWQGTAFYRSGNYEYALKKFLQDPSATGYYNRGNALAHMGQYKKALGVYEEAIRIKPNFEDAKFNRDLMKKLLKENKQQQTTTKKPSLAKQQQKNKNVNSPSKSKKKSKDKKQNKKNQNGKQNDQNKQTKKQPQQRITKQMLRRIPDDPGGLLKQKFLRDYLKRHQKS